jgi:flagellar hook-associated protein 2
MNPVTPNPIFRQQNPYEPLIQELLQVDGQKKRDLQSQEKVLQNKKSAISDIGSKMTALNSLLSSFNDPFDNKLNPLAGQSSNKEAVSVVSTNGMENPGNYNISISQLAKNDIMLSGSMASDGNTLSSSGSASFTIGVNGKSASIMVNTANLTNRDVMDAIAGQVNDQLGDILQASVFDLGDGNSELSFKSAKTGEQSYISITNVQGDASSLNLNNMFSQGSLDAKFTIDGVSFQRSSNTVDDAVQGLSFKLKQATSQPVGISITNDTDSARKTIQSFIDKFNDVNSLIRQKTHLNGESGDHGPLQDERVIRNLSFSLRQDAALPVESMAGQQSIQSLADIGIDLKQDGTMYIEDSGKLDNALQSSPDSVKQLFTADDGLANKLQNTIEQAIKGDANTFDSIKDGIDRKMDRLDDRIASQNNYLDNEEQKLRQKYANLRQIISQGQLQFNRLSIFRSSFGI